MDLDRAVAAVLALPGVTEADHHGRRSFRVGAGTVLATVPSDGVLNVLVGEELAQAVAAQPGVTLLTWGMTTPGVCVELTVVDPDLLDELLHAAWSRRAPASLRRQLPG
ncbi:MmcQ/YjbR family DNA-binding protein [Modestobacter muralis]|uniref:MmcQ/YjbR family DNA-binding protein n=1 Tax=Modestobacter muralis TaxID=1608614 RepID=A0A6P0EYH0_9ACTN|nr:MmcQ/YjbR family DNA-binding protein [Modestobacter muralis]NEK96105.1 MmcQ/YjbR family DNA-binding protein [Modestobacter muralis]NEN52993.1 MmcQ/YjbR family DNA-binding protein [Modestobacter muralis]